jgi:hypothetical protein
MEKLKEFPLAGIASLLLGYITFCGASWHLGYWSTFNFNYLEYAKIGELFKSSIYLLLSDTWIFLVLIIAFMGMGAPMQILIRHRSKNVNNPPQPFKIGRWTLIFLIMASSFLVFIFGGLLMRSNKNWGFLPFAFSILFGCLLFISGILQKFIKDESSRLLFLTLVFLIPFYSYGSAKRKSGKIKAMFIYKEVESIETTDSLLNKRLARTAYLGGTNNHYFFYTPDQIIVVNAGNVESITLTDRVNDQNYVLWMNRYSFR